MKVLMKFYMALLTGVFLIGAPCVMAQEATEDTPRTQTYRNTMLALGERQFKTGAVNEAFDTFSRLAEAFPQDAYIQTRLAYVHLKRQEFKEAETIFKIAQKLDPTRVEAYVGLGLTYAENPTRGMQALYNFRRAIAEAKRATRIDPNYGPAYRLLGEAYERFQEDHTRALSYYLKYIELEPNNPEGLYYFGLAAVQAKDFEKITQHLTPYLDDHPEVNQLLPLAAQGHFYAEEYQKALEFFERFLKNIDGSERQHYTDISYIASEKELVAYAAITSPEERQAYREQFWARRDPDILTKINERVIEHYRRIWYARTFFSSNVYPWDQRGVVYIRYGEPDHRSRSTDRNFVQSPEVDAVRTKMATDIYGAEAAFLTFTGPVFPVRTSDQVSTLFERPELLDTAADGGAVGEEGTAGEDDAVVYFAPHQVGFSRDPFANEDNSVPSRLDDRTGQLNTRLQFGKFAPVTIDNEVDTVPWETWTYTLLNGGIEITFTDEMGNGRYAFAPLPDATADDPDAIQYIGRMTEHTPEVIYQTTRSRTPDFYRPGRPGDVLNFYYDMASFRGNSGQTAVEIYYGIPPEQIQPYQASDSTFIHVQLAIALADEGHTAIYRTAEEFVYQSTSELAAARGAFVPEILKTQVPPGKYELQVQLKDLISGRTGIYRQDMEINDYRPQELQISDIQLASAIADAGPTKFQKETIWIIPMPTRNYGEKQNVYAYFEIYNLTKDPFGQTRYKAQYRVRSSTMPSVGVFGAVATGLRSIFKSQKPQVAITYDQVGRESDEREYVEIDLSSAKPGVNALEVTITDLVTGKIVEREVNFRYGQ